MDEGAIAGAEAAADGVQVFSDEDAWDVLEDIPNDSAAALILIEHHWAVPRDAVARAGGVRLNDAFISPLDLIGIGMVSAADAEALHALETRSDSSPGDHDHPMEVTGCSHPAGSLGARRAGSLAAGASPRGERPLPPAVTPAGALDPPPDRGFGPVARP